MTRGPRWSKWGDEPDDGQYDEADPEPEDYDNDPRNPDWDADDNDRYLDSTRGNEGVHHA